MQASKLWNAYKMKSRNEKRKAFDTILTGLTARSISFLNSAFMRKKGQG